MDSTVSRPARLISPQRVAAVIASVGLGVSAILATHLSVLVIAEWGQR